MLTPARLSARPFQELAIAQQAADASTSNGQPTPSFPFRPADRFYNALEAGLLIYRLW
jgi:hypothetical protein